MSKRILIVDDGADINTALREIFESNGFTASIHHLEISESRQDSASEQAVQIQHV